MKKNKVFHRIGGKRNNQNLTIDEWDRQMTEVANENVAGAYNNLADNDGSRMAALEADAQARTQSITSEEDPVIADEIPPFDITISMANEYGKAAVMVLYGVEILNQGSQMSMDHIQTQVACTFVARRLKCLEAVDLTKKNSSAAATAA